MMNTNPVKAQAEIFEKLMIIAKGSNSVISTSKIRKITAIKKNRREKGSRADPLGSKPHSNGEFFSRSMTVFFAKREARIITTALMIKVIVIEINKTIIAFPRNFLDPLVGSQIYYYTKKASSSSINGDIKEESNYIYKVSIPSGSFKSEMMSSWKMTFI